ncbi:sugar-specific transcriptional regulator TrmB [Lysinibacillus parviboronicapiens]|uniref:Sugar-specific transcriptional regulator TrmB n=1 Tax=Lysinibacillus parviboronicapiens TaxID=436516 RepID=A0ABV2PR49_9BACI|nr:helix-turn-helix domain-containing protein [Lysinibacillus parviboronicapiens]
MELINQLKQLGYTEYEAKAYIALVQNNHVTAYQVSKHSGIPRARIYGILDLLVEKGLVMKEETPEITTYTALAVSVFLQKVEKHWQSSFKSMSSNLESLEQQEPVEDNKVLSIKDKDTIITYCQSMLKKAKKRVLISMWDDVYEELREDLQKVAQQVKVHGITLHVTEPLASLDQHRVTDFTEKTTTDHWFILSIDGKEMIYGPSPANRELAFFTDDPIHIYLLEDYIWHDVLVNRLVKRSKDDLGDWITKERHAFFGA